MFPIIIVGNSKEIAFSQQLTAALSKIGNVLHVSECRIFHKAGKEEDFVIVETEGSKEIAVNCGVKIFKEPNVIIIESKAEEISCGMSAHDTISISSYFEDRASVSLQKPIKGKNGTIEPKEVPIRLGTKYDKYVLMCLVAILLLSGIDFDTLNL